jgi:hypothetical protein
MKKSSLRVFNQSGEKCWANHNWLPAIFGTNGVNFPGGPHVNRPSHQGKPTINKTMLRTCDQCASRALSVLIQSKLSKICRIKLDQKYKKQDRKGFHSYTLILLVNQVKMYSMGAKIR